MARQSVVVNGTPRAYYAPDGPFPREHVPNRTEAARRKFAQELEAATANL